MSHIAPEPPSRRRLDRIIGSFIALIGVAAAIIAVVALQHPNGRSVDAAKQSISTNSAGNENDTESPQTSTAGASATATAHPTSSSAAKTASAKTSASPTSSSSISSSAPGSPSGGSKAIPLIVLNNTTQTGLGATAKNRFVQGGWTVSSVGNLTNNIASTCVYYDPGNSANLAAATALQSQFPAVKRIKEKFSGLPSGPLVVVLTPDYTS